MTGDWQSSKASSSFFRSLVYIACSLAANDLTYFFPFYYLA